MHTRELDTKIQEKLQSIFQKSINYIRRKAHHTYSGKVLTSRKKNSGKYSVNIQGKSLPKGETREQKRSARPQTSPTQ